MITVYAIKSNKRNYIYVGMTNNLCRRFSDHNKGLNKSTRPYLPYSIIYLQSFGTRQAARNHEKYLKSGIGKEFLRQLV
ncbi:MAG: GIY-YIG nuclease family protein [Maribacter sp.]|nr:GIY-YIG nuclease family protein [Maribacter sp.]